MGQLKGGEGQYAGRKGGSGLKLDTLTKKYVFITSLENTQKGRLAGKKGDKKQR